MFSSRLRVFVSNKRDLIAQTKRSISKTPSSANSDSLSSTLRQQPKNEKPSKWARFSKLSNERALSTLQVKSASQVKKSSVVSKDESREFMAIFPDIVRDLTDAGRHTDIPEATKWYTKVLQYNVPTGKKSRGLAVVASYKLLEKPENLTPENIKRAIILGWCVEMLQAHFLIVDDIMDGSEMRRGVPCWYKNKDVGLNAINDALLIEAGVYSILRKYFSELPCYLPIIELFHDVAFKTSMGQNLDCHSQKNGRPDLANFTMNRYNAIVKYKTSYYTFRLPVAVAMYLSGIYEEEIHRQAKTILLEIGHFFQVQDDFLDTFGDPEVTRKVGTDIREGKCSWLIVAALQKASIEQKALLERHYGVATKESEDIVKNLYIELGIPQTYAIYEEETYNIIKTHIQQISKGLPHQLFFKIMDTIYRREC